MTGTAFACDKLMSSSTRNQYILLITQVWRKSQFTFAQASSMRGNSTPPRRTSRLYGANYIAGLRKAGAPGPGSAVSRRRFWGSEDPAVGVERGEIGVLEDLAVDRHRHALLDLAPEAGVAAIELQDHPAEIVRLHLELGLPAGEPAGRLAGDDDARHVSAPAGHSSFPRKRES